MLSEDSLINKNMSNRLTIDKFYGGMSKDALFAQEGQFDYAENMCLDNTSYLTLGKKARQLASTGGNEITSIIGVSNGTTNKVFYFTEDAEVYTTTSADNIPDYDLSTITDVSTRPIMNSFAYDGNLYLIQQDSNSYFYVHKISVIDAISGNWQNLEARFMSRTTYANFQNYWFPLVVDNNGQVYIGNGKTLVTFDIATGGVGGGIIEVDGEIRGVTLGANTFKVYTSTGNLLYYTSQGDLQERVDITISPSIVKTVKNVDYIIGKFSGDYDNSLYYMNGYKVESIVQKDKTGEFTKWKIMSRHSDNLQFDGKKIYFVAQDKTYSDVIVSMGPIKPGFPEAINYSISGFNNEAEFDGTIAFSAIHCFYSYKGIIYLGHSGGADGIGRILLNEAGSQREGMWLSSKYNLGSSTAKKEIVEIRVRGDFISDWNTFTVVLDDSKKAAITLPSGQLTDNIRLTNFNDEFINIQFEWTTRTRMTTQTASKLYGIELIYNIIED